MSGVEKMRAFIIKFLYLLIWAGVIYCVLKYALPFFMPFAIAFVLKPLINKISSKFRWNRKLVAILILSILYIAAGVLIAFLGVRIVVYLADLFGRLPDFYAGTIEPAIDSVSSWFDGFLLNFDPAVLSFFETASNSISNAISTLITSISSGAINILTGVATKVPMFVVTFVVTIISSYFFVVDYYKVTSFFSRQLTPKLQKRLVVIKDFVINVLFKFLKAYFILLSITFVEVSIGLLILRVPMPFLIALITAIVDILPVLGTGTVMIPWALYNLFTGNYFLGIGLLVLYAIITVIRQILEPRVVGKQIGLYPLLTLACMFVGARFFGFWGMLGLPVAVTVIIYLNRVGEIKLFKE